MAVTHKFSSAKSDGSDATLVQPSNWNAAHYADMAFEIVLENGGSVLATGVYADIECPFDGTITSYTLLADQTGSLVVDLWKNTYANFPPTVADTITASAKPTLSSAVKATNSTLTGWTKTFTAGDVIRINIDSASTIIRATLSLRVQST